MNRLEFETRLNELKDSNGVWICLGNSNFYGASINEIVNLPDENCIYLRTQNKKIDYSNIMDFMIV